VNDGPANVRSAAGYITFLPLRPSSMSQYPPDEPQKKYFW
jgi:hypothetical protein